MKKEHPRSVLLWASVVTKLIYASALICLFFAATPKAQAALNVVNAGSVTFSTTSATTFAVNSLASDLLVMVEAQATVSNVANLAPTDSRGQTWNLVTTSTLNASTEISMYYIANSLSIATASCNF